GGVGLVEIEAASPTNGPVTFELILLPLVHTRDSVDRILGAMTPLLAPDWLGHDVLLDKHLLRSEVIWPSGRPQSVLDALSRQAPFLPHVRKAR
ncbi:hypothetical protein ACWTQZ_26660, partial [Escherichia coli]